MILAILLKCEVLSDAQSMNYTYTHGKYVGIKYDTKRLWIIRDTLHNFLSHALMHI